jgi:hypothetical protein
VTIHRTYRDAPYRAMPHRYQMLTTEPIWEQRWFVGESMDLTVNTKEISMDEHDIVELGTASIETRQPVYPPVFFDGLSFQYFRPW